MNKLRKSVVTILIGVLIASCRDVTSVPADAVTETISPTVKAIDSTSTALPIATDTPIPILSFYSEGLRIAYYADGIIYLQNQSDKPIQVTNDGNNLFPTFSDDGEKLVFLRGLVPRDLYSVGLDGENEQLLISGNILRTVGQDYNELSELRSFAFIPETHLIVFNTRQLGEDDVKNQDWNRTFSQNKNDLLILDLNNGRIRQLLSPGSGGNFVISPDGKLIAVQGNGYIDIVDINGQVVSKKLATFLPTQPYILDPRMFWTSDSKELIVSLPARNVYDLSGPETLTVWRFEIDGSGKTQINLNPPLLQADYEVSPDGNWILYNYFYYPGKTDESITSGLYLGNLHDGSSQLYAQSTVYPIWNPDSIHFVYDGPFLGSVDKSPVSLGRGRFLGWLDASRYLFYQSETENLLIVEINGVGVSIPHTIPENSFRIGPAVFSFVFVESD